MTRRVGTLVAGAGIVGLMVARELARRGAPSVEVVDAAPSLLLGASGRNGGGVRAQWTTRENIELARRSIAAFRRLAGRTGYHTWFRQGGYLLLARDEATMTSLRKARNFQSAHGVRTRLLTPEEATEIVPGLDVKGVVGASFNPEDGTLFPWPVVHGVAERVRAHGIPIRLGLRITRLEASTNRVVGVETSAGRIEAENVVLALGAATRELVAPLGIDLPLTSQRHEILVTEALKPFLSPMLVDLGNGLYASQAMRGEIIGGLGHPAPTTESWASTFEFAANFSRGLTRLLPNLGSVNVLRQWAGSYDMTPDARPILGRVGPWENLHVACGFSGHGFMLAPAVSELVADLVLEGRTDLPREAYGLERFEKGVPEAESLVIG